jgi:hypothetical protein
MANARDVRIIHMPLQSIPPAKSLHAASNHQLTPEDIRSSLDALLVSHALADILPVEVSLVDPNSATDPLRRIHPKAVTFHVALEVRNAVVLLLMNAPVDGTLEAIFFASKQGGVFALQVARASSTPVRVRTSRPASTLLRFRGGGTSGRGGHRMGGLGIGCIIALLLLVVIGGLRWTILVVVVVVVVGRRNVVVVTIGLGGVGREG